MKHPFSVFRDLYRPEQVPPDLEKGNLVKILCFSDCVFPIRGIDGGLWLLDGSGEDSEEPWAVWAAPDTKLLGIVVWVGKNIKGEIIWDILVGEKEAVIRIDPTLMAGYPYHTDRGCWKLVQIFHPEDV